MQDHEEMRKTSLESNLCRRIMRNYRLDVFRPTIMTVIKLSLRTRRKNTVIVSAVYFHTSVFLSDLKIIYKS